MISAASAAAIAGLNVAAGVHVAPVAAGSAHVPPEVHSSLAVLHVSMLLQLLVVAASHP